MKQTICFTGKRPKDLWGYDITQYRDLNRELKYSLRHLCYHSNFNLRYAIFGGAQGFDQLAFWACDIATTMDKILYLPFKNQEKNWNEHGAFGQLEYHNMLAVAREIVVCSDIDPATASKSEISAAYLKRNRDMVDAADICFGLFDTKLDFHSDKSGTAATLRYAEQQNKEIYLMDITNLGVSHYE